LVQDRSQWLEYEIGGSMFAKCIGYCISVLWNLMSNLSLKAEL
jgi:hypothetical protein